MGVAVGTFVAVGGIGVFVAVAVFVGVLVGVFVAVAVGVFVGGTGVFVGGASVGSEVDSEAEAAASWDVSATIVA